MRLIESFSDFTVNSLGSKDEVRGCLRCFTQADEDPLESLVAAGLQVEQRQLVVRVVLRLVAIRLEQDGRSVQLQHSTHT